MFTFHIIAEANTSNGAKERQADTFRTYTADVVWQRHSWMFRTSNYSRSYMNPFIAAYIDVRY